MKVIDRIPLKRRVGYTEWGNMCIEQLATRPDSDALGVVLFNYEKSREAVAEPRWPEEPKIVRVPSDNGRVQFGWYIAVKGAE